MYTYCAARPGTDAPLQRLQRQCADDLIIYMYIYIYIYAHLSLSLYIYIYIHTHIISIYIFCVCFFVCVFVSVLRILLSAACRQPEGFGVPSCLLSRERKSFRSCSPKGLRDIYSAKADRNLTRTPKGKQHRKKHHKFLSLGVRATFRVVA